MLILLVGALLRFVPIWFGLPYPQTRPDEEVSLGLALNVLQGDLNPHFFHWPSLAFYVFAGVLGAASGVRDLFDVTAPMTFADHALVARATVALFGTLTILVLFRLAQRIAGDTVGGLAAAFLAGALLHVRESHFAMTDVLMTFLLWTSLLLIVTAALAEWRATPSIGASTIAYACAGLAGGLATSTKYNAAAVAVAVVATRLLRAWDRPSSVLRWQTWMPAVAFGTTFAAGFIVATPYAVLDYLKFTEDLRYVFTHLSGGHMNIDLGRGWIYHATYSLPYGAGFAACAAALVGVVPFVRRHGRAAIVLGSFAVAFYVVVGSGYTVFFRYVLPLIPLICLLAAIGVTVTSAWLVRRTGLNARLALVLVAAVSVGPGLFYSAWFDLLLARTDTRVLAGDWLTHRLQPGASLHDAGGRYTRLDLWRVKVFRSEYDPDRNAFSNGDLPAWLVLHSSDLAAYAATLPALASLARERYVPVYQVLGTRGEGPGVHDRQDAFFLPFSRFQDVVRPGPTITIYRRADLPPLAEPQ